MHDMPEEVGVRCAFSNRRNPAQTEDRVAVENHRFTPEMMVASSLVIVSSSMYRGWTLELSSKACTKNYVI